MWRRPLRSTGVITWGLLSGYCDLPSFYSPLGLRRSNTHLMSAGERTQARRQALAELWQCAVSVDDAHRLTMRLAAANALLAGRLEPVPPPPGSWRSPSGLSPAAALWSPLRSRPEPPRGLALP